MSRVLLVVLALVALYSSCALSEQKIPCKANEIYSNCANPCMDQCPSLNPSRVCPAYCMLGCQCVEGYKRDASGVCIPVEQC